MTNKTVFVYGTLRTGGYFSFILPKAKQTQLTKVVGVKMYNLGSFPGAIITNSKDDYVTGEVCDFSNLSNKEWRNLLYKLDSVENVAGGLFKRATIETPFGNSLIYVADREAWFDEELEVRNRFGEPFELLNDWAEIDNRIVENK